MPVRYRRGQRQPCRAPPLVAPENYAYRVGFERRESKVGQIRVFDATIEPQARNDSDALRIVLIFDIWNPLLAPVEREVVRTLASASRAFNATLCPPNPVRQNCRDRL